MTGDANPASGRLPDWHETCVCGHEETDHEAGECWATLNGHPCGCAWFTAKVVIGDA